jgi:hypothetical protein
VTISAPLVFLLALATGTISSLFTLIGAYWFLVRPLRGRLHAELEPLLEEAEDRVKRGVLNAGEELLPRFRAEVRRGLKEGVSGLGTDLFETGTQTAVKTGVGLLKSSLDAITGKPPGKRHREGG